MQWSVLGGGSMGCIGESWFLSLNCASSGFCMLNDAVSWLLG